MPGRRRPRGPSSSRAPSRSWRIPIASRRPLLHAELIAIGSELLLGGRQDTNSLFLTDGLAEIGIEVRHKVQVGDDPAEIAGAIRSARRRAQVIVMTGGLGPTVDDCTREAVAAAISRPLRRRPEALADVTRRLAEWKRPLRPQHRRQALLPQGATMLRNPVGSAPGFILPWKGAVLMALPGVPAEAAGMFEEEAVPELVRAFPGRTGSGMIERRLVHTFGLSEAEVERRLRDLFRGRPDCRVGFLASPLGVTVSLLAVSPPDTGTRRKRKPERADQDLSGLAQRVRARLKPYVYGQGGERMEEVIGRLLTASGLTLALAESCTGGLIVQRLTQIPGSSVYVDRAVVCYSNDAKEQLAGVSRRLLRQHGAVSAPVAAAMARGIRRASGADLGVSVTGIAGPGGATFRKPVGLVYVGLDAAGLAHPVVREFRLHGDRQMITRRASQAALDLLRRHLTSRDRTKLR